MCVWGRGGGALLGCSVIHHRPGLVTVNPKGLCTFLATKEICCIKGCSKEESYCIDRRSR